MEVANMSETNSSKGDEHTQHDSHSKHDNILTPEEVDAILEKLESEIRNS
jgi:hypothetical protein